MPRSVRRPTATNILTAPYWRGPRLAGLPRRPGSTSPTRWPGQWRPNAPFTLDPQGPDSSPSRLEPALRSGGPESRRSSTYAVLAPHPQAGPLLHGPPTRPYPGQTQADLLAGRVGPQPLIGSLLGLPQRSRPTYRRVLGGRLKPALGGWLATASFVAMDGPRPRRPAKNLATGALEVSPRPHLSPHPSPSASFAKVSEQWKRDSRRLLRAQGAPRLRRRPGAPSTWTPAVLDFLLQGHRARPYPLRQVRLRTVAIDLHSGGGMENIISPPQQTLPPPCTMPGPPSDLSPSEEPGGRTRRLPTSGSADHRSTLFRDWSKRLAQRRASPITSFTGPSTRGTPHGQGPSIDAQLGRVPRRVLSLRGRCHPLNQYRPPSSRRLVYRSESHHDVRRPQTYAKGALVLHMGSRFPASAKRVGGKGHPHLSSGPLRRAHPLVTRDLQEADGGLLPPLGAAPSGPAPSFDQLRSPTAAGHPELKVRWDWQPETHQVHVEIRQTQELTAGDPASSPSLWRSHWSARRRTVVAPATGSGPRALQGSLTGKADERPRTVVLDPKGLDS